MSKVADLHVHTNFSDGTDTVEKVIELAKQSGLDALAITDHDNIDAFPAAWPIAKHDGLELITAIEMSATEDGLEVHLLGYLIDLESDVLQKHLAKQQARRVERVHEMVRRLKRMGVQIEAQEILQLSGSGTVGRPHVAAVLLKHGYISTLSEAFSRYIGPDNPAFVPGSPLSPAQVIGVIRDSHGVPVLAHPVYLNRDSLIGKFIDEGLVGLEVYHSGHNPELVRHYEELADHFNLLKTGGSDYHGSSQEGAPIGSVKIPYALIEALKNWKSRLQNSQR